MEWGERAPAEAESLEQVLERIQPRVKSLISRHDIPPQDVEDLMQETLLAFVHKRHSIRNPASWLAGTVRKKCLMYHRTHRRRLYHAVDAAVLELIAGPQSPEQKRTELACDLDTCIARIPKRCRSILRLRYDLGYKPAEVAKQMGYRSSSIRKVTSRCIAALTRQMLAAGYTSAQIGD